jgi:hypothetical protein
MKSSIHNPLHCAGQIGTLTTLQNIAYRLAKEQRHLTWPFPPRGFAPWIEHALFPDAC